MAGNATSPACPPGLRANTGLVKRSERRLGWLSVTHHKINGPAFPGIGIIDCVQPTTMAIDLGAGFDGEPVMIDIARDLCGTGQRYFLHTDLTVEHALIRGRVDGPNRRPCHSG